jgi:hypothetical protein
MGGKSLLFLLLMAVGLSAYAYFFERTAPSWERIGRVFPDLEPGDIYEMEISRPVNARDAGAGVDARPIRLRHEGTPASWWIVEPIHFEAFHPRVQGILYDLVNLVRVAEVPPGGDSFSTGPELTLRFKTRTGGESTLEIGKDHPDAQIEFCYARLDKSCFVTRKDLRKALTASLNDLRSRALFSIAPPDAEDLLIRSGEKLKKRIERQGTTSSWRLREPIDALADRELMESLLTDLNSWTIVSFVSDHAERPEDLPPFGLGEPQAIVTLRGKEARSVTVEIGKEIEENGVKLVYTRFVRMPFVFTAKRDPLENLLEGAESLRARYIFDLGLEEVAELRGEAKGGGWTLRRLGVTAKEREGKKTATPEDHVWQVKDSATGDVFPGDKKEIEESLLVSLRKLLILKFADPGSSLETVGLSPPEGKLEMRTSGGAVLQLLLGLHSSAPEDEGLNIYHVAIPGEPGSFLVGTALPDLLKAGGYAFRKKDISELDSAQLVEFEIKDGASSWTLGRSPGEEWMLAETAVSPPAEPPKVHTPTVDQLLRALHRDIFRAKRFLPELKDFASHGIELQAPRRAVVFQSPRDLPGFRKIVLGDRLEGAGPLEITARVDTENVPPFTLEEEGVPSSFDALVRHLREITRR